LSTIVLKMEYINISKSKIRRDLLVLFFTNITERYYLRELQRRFGYSAGSIRRELVKLENDGLLVTQRTGNLLFYSLNTRHPLFKELKSIVAKTVGIEGGIRNGLSRVKNIRTAFIYGSFAAKRETGKSDIDLMIVGEPNTTRLNGVVAELEHRLNREINTTIYSTSEYRDKKDSKTGFIRDLLKNPKIMLIGKKDDL